MSKGVFAWPAAVAVVVSVGGIVLVMLPDVKALFR